jgi:hypothetical protein
MLTRPRCRAENPPRAKFCIECAAPLATPCAGCGATLPPAARVCPECARPVEAAPARSSSPESYTPRHLAEKILTTAGTLAGERKQVTVLFVDVSGFTAWRLKGESATARRRWDEADEALRRALAYAEEIGHPRHRWLNLLALGRLDAARGRRAEAVTRYRQAWAVIADLQSRTRDAALRAGLESMPLVREIADLARLGS